MNSNDLNIYSIKQPLNDVAEIASHLHISFQPLGESMWVRWNGYTRDALVKIQVKLRNVLDMIHIDDKHSFVRNHVLIMALKCDMCIDMMNDKKLDIDMYDATFIMQFASEVQFLKSIVDKSGNKYNNVFVPRELKETFEKQIKYKQEEKILGETIATRISKLQSDNSDLDWSDCYESVNMEYKLKCKYG